MQAGQYEPDTENTSLLGDAEHTQENLIASRSPHPYHRHSFLESNARVKPDLASRSRQEPLLQRTRTSGNEEGEHHAIQTRRPKDSLVASPSESGTEADDEGYTYNRALPAPPLRPRKGLKIGFASGIDGAITPLLTPTTLDDDASRFNFDFARFKKPGVERTSTDEELRTARAKFVKRRRAELSRRASEVLFLILIGLLILSNELVSSSIGRWHRGEFGPSVSGKF